MKKLSVLIFSLYSFILYAQSINPELLKRANAGDASAQYEVGNIYYGGYNVLQDYKKAAEWYLKAANQGYAPAQNDLGYMYRYGEGLTQDYK
ncbi:MAG: hypothetical protein LBP51_05505, partial [Deferribacteraceae bacterium]|nr:hypothetical protein [Deferribacteraceae bacterium]